MVDLRLFRRPTFLGSTVAMLGYAAAAQVMMTYLPLYLQNAYGQSPVGAGLAMLPFALPLFFCPRLAAWLALSISGRALLTLGLAIVAVGDLATGALAAAGAAYPLLAFGMLVAGCGAGLLNGETAKVSMSVVPPERGGMASGISATTRFVGIVTGLTGLGAILAAGTERHVATAAAAAGLPLPGGDAGRLLVSRIVAGDVGGALGLVPENAREVLLGVARAGFQSGFAGVMLVAGGVAAAAALATFVLISPTETAAPAAERDPALRKVESV